MYSLGLGYGSREKANLSCVRPWIPSLKVHTPHHAIRQVPITSNSNNN